MSAPEVDTRPVATVLWTFVRDADRVPDALRELADRLDETDAVLLGLWSTGFGTPDQIVLQVIVDPDRSTQ